MAKKKRCRTCAFWARLTGEHDVKYHGPHAGRCQSNAFEYTGDCGGHTAIDGFTYWDGESYTAGFETGEEFGCVHWTKRN